MAGIHPDDIDDEDAGEDNSSGVGLNTTLPAEPDKASNAFAGGPELGDVNAQGPVMPAKNTPAFLDPDAQTDVNVDPHWHHPILPKSAKAQP